jgi:hypothetical protein
MCAFALLAASTFWYFGFLSFPSLKGAFPWFESTKEHNSDSSYSAHQPPDPDGTRNDGAKQLNSGGHPDADAEGHSRQYTFDAAILEEEVSAQARYMSELRFPLQTLLQAQTALANGTAGAEGMHKKALVGIADKLKAFSHRTLTRQEVELLTVYLFSGGEVSLVENILSALEKDPPGKELLDGAIAFGNRDLDLADGKLRNLDLVKLPPPVLSRVLLAQSQTTSSLDAKEKAKLLEQAASLSVGTLVEEASLRRLVQLWADVANARQLVKWSRRYLRRYPESYYMDDFVKSLGNGILRTARRGDAPGRDDIDYFLRSLDPRRAGQLAQFLTKSALDAGLKTLCTTISDAAVQTLPKTSTELNIVLIQGLACKAAEKPATVLEELADPGVAAGNTASQQVLKNARALASNILKENHSRIPRTPGEALDLDPQLEIFAASVTQQLKDSLTLLQESKK